MSTFNRASTSLPQSSTDDISPLREEGKINVPKRTSSRKILSKNSSKKNVLPEQQTKPSEIYLDKEALQSFVPVLSVTEGTPLHQSLVVTKRNLPSDYALPI